MGIGTLRRYHARPDEGVIPATAMAPQPQGEQNPEVVDAATALQRASAIEASLSEQVETAQGDPDFDPAALEELRQEYSTASQRVEEAKIHLEEVELKVKDEAEAKALADAAAAKKAPEGQPNRNGSKAIWTDWALAHGKTAEDLKGLGRDDIAVLFLGPKE